MSAQKADPQTTIPAAMTPAERKRWYLAHGATRCGTPEAEFAVALERRGIVAAYDAMADVTYWALTPAGERAMFGDRVDD